MRLVEHQSAWQQQKSGESRSADSSVYILESFRQGHCSQVPYESASF